MPKLLIVGGYIFVIYSADIAENRRHIHIESKKGRFRKSAKFWLEPKIELVDKGNFQIKEISFIKKIIVENINILNAQIDKFLSGKKVEVIIVR